MKKVLIGAEATAPMFFFPLQRVVSEKCVSLPPLF